MLNEAEIRAERREGLNFAPHHSGPTAALAGLTLSHEPIYSSMQTSVRHLKIVVASGFLKR